MTDIDIAAIRARIAAARADEPDAAEPEEDDTVSTSTDVRVIAARMFGRASDLDHDADRMYGNEPNHIGRRIFGR